MITMALYSPWRHCQTLLAALEAVPVSLEIQPGNEDITWTKRQMEFLDLKGNYLKQWNFTVFVIKSLWRVVKIGLLLIDQMLQQLL